MFVGLLFYIPELAQGTYRKSKISNPWRRWKNCCCCCCGCIPIMTPTPWFSKNHHNLQNLSKENVIVFCFFLPNPIWGTLKYFSHNTLCLWVSFSTSLSKHKAHIENPKFLTPGGGEIIIVVVIIVGYYIQWCPRKALREATPSSVCSLASAQDSKLQDLWGL